MKQWLKLALGTMWLCLLAAPVQALNIYVDAAPNVYGSPDYAGWAAATKASVVAGTFQNMSNGVDAANVGTTNFEIQDEVVYSFGDLGKRLTWIYWIPGETVASLTGRFQIGLTNVWDGTAYDFYADYYGSTWLEPTKWEDYDGGVIGFVGMAYWGAYGANTPEALAADIAAWGAVSEEWVFTARLDGVETSITSHRDAEVPEPATLLLVAAGLASLAGFRTRKTV
jgi:hypothetical protein